MTCLQVVKLLDKQIEASYRRGASDPTKVALRADIRKAQDLFRRAHKLNVITRTLQEATESMLKHLTPADGQAIRAILNSADTKPTGYPG